MTALKPKKKYNYYFTNNMNNQHLLDSFLETVLEPDKETINYHGVEIPFPSLAQAELDRQFNLNLKNNVSPRDFEKVVDGVIVSIKLDLKKKYKLYYFLLYNISYLRKNKIDLTKESKFNLEEINELLFSTEENVFKYYEQIKRLSLN
jgi:hypothetical protein